MDYAIKAQRPAGRPRRPRTFAEGRVCAADECETQLSRYNKREFCHVHAPVRYPRVRGRFIDAD